MFTLDMTGKITVVTGAGGGIGRGIAEVFAEAGSKVYVINRRVEKAEETVRLIHEKGGVAEPVGLDVTDSAALEATLDRIVETDGKIDNMITCAGIAYTREYMDATEEELRRTLDVNVIAVDNCCRGALKYMIPRKQGKIVNIASAASRMGHPYMAHYSTSKFGIIGLTQSIALAAAEHNINVNSICPGIIPSNLGQNQGGTVIDVVAKKTGMDPAAMFQSVVDSLPFKRLQTPEDVGMAALFLCSEFACNITGQALNVDGGYRMN